MCSIPVIEFFIEQVKPEEFMNRRILEVGSRYVNGSVRPLIEKFFQPREYIGIDIEPGKFVDIVMPAEKLLDYFGPESFDVVISTAVLEHVKDWRIVINNMKSVLRKGGYIYITTVSHGFPYHGYPYDFWRYELSDIKRIFLDFEILALKRDYRIPGVFLKARKPENWAPVDLDNIALYSVLLGRRTKNIVDIKDAPLSRRLMLKFINSRARWLLPSALMRLIEKRFTR